MPRLTKIYTRKGDQGETSLGSGSRVRKDALRVQVYGTIDELNATIGLALAGGLTDPLPELLTRIQNDLFHLGAQLSTPITDPPGAPIPQIEERHLVLLEGWLEELNQQVDPLKNFILPGGSPGAARLHLARTVCRRAERLLVALVAVEPVGDYALPFLNRLSDLLFVMARYENKQRGIAEPLWDSHA